MMDTALRERPTNVSRQQNNQEKQLFQIKMKINDHEKKLIVYETDSLQMLTLRFCQINSLSINDNLKHKIEQKIMNNFKSMIDSSKTDNQLRNKIQKYLQKQAINCRHKTNIIKNPDNTQYKTQKYRQQYRQLQSEKSNKIKNKQNKKILKNSVTTKKQKNYYEIQEVESSKTGNNNQQRMSVESNLKKVYQNIYKKSIHNDIKSMAKQMLTKKSKKSCTKTPRQSSNQQIIVKQNQDSINNTQIKKQSTNYDIQNFKCNKMPNTVQNYPSKRYLITQKQPKDLIRTDRSTSAYQQIQDILSYSCPKYIKNQNKCLFQRNSQKNSKFCYIDNMNNADQSLIKEIAINRSSQSLQAKTNRSYEHKSFSKFGTNSKKSSCTRIHYETDIEKYSSSILKHQNLLMRHAYDDNVKYHSLSKYDNTKKYRYLQN